MQRIDTPDLSLAPSMVGSRIVIMPIVIYFSQSFFRFSRYITVNIQVSNIISYQPVLWLLFCLFGWSCFGIKMTFSDSPFLLQYA